MNNNLIILLTTTKYLMENNKFLLISISLVMALMVSSCSKSYEQPLRPIESTTPPVQSTISTIIQQGNGAGSGKYAVEITSNGFSPKELTIKEGDTVVFMNKDNTKHWPASAVHPTHQVYPEPGGCIGSKFDSCKNLAQGEIFEFEFTHKGVWKYHDHSNPSLQGVIVVE